MFTLTELREHVAQCEADLKAIQEHDAKLQAMDVDAELEEEDDKVADRVVPNGSEEEDEEEMQEEELFAMMAEQREQASPSTEEGEEEDVDGRGDDGDGEDLVAMARRYSHVHHHSRFHPPSDLQRQPRQLEDEGEKEEAGGAASARRMPFECEVCDRTFYFTPPQIARHRASHAKAEAEAEAD